MSNQGSIELIEKDIGERVLVTFNLLNGKDLEVVPQSNLKQRTTYSVVIRAENTKLLKQEVGVEAITVS